MSFNITSRKFYDIWTSTGGGGTDYLNSCQCDKITCVIEGNFFWASENRHLIFDSATKTITIYGDNDNYSFITDGFKLGDTFTLVGTGSNDGNYTIASIEDRVIITVETLVNEDAGSCSIYGTTLITALDFYYNLIENSAGLTFDSFTDIGTIQRYSAKGLDASVATPVFLEVATASQGWVTDAITNGVSTESKIEGDGIVSYKQKFIITQVFRQSSMWNNSLQGNFSSKKVPSSFQNGKHLKHIFQVDGKFDYNTPTVDHTGGLSTSNGAGSWFNQSSNQGLPEYNCSSISYKNYATSEVIDQIDGSIVTEVTMIINSRSGKFTTTTSKFNISHFLCPLDQTKYSDTQTTLLQNIRYDEALQTVAAGAIDGINVGTDYQSIKNVVITYISADQVIVVFQVDYSSATKSVILNNGINDRYYSINVECQDIAITTTKGVDRVNTICDFRLSDYDVRESANLELVDFIYCYPYPNYGVYEANNVVGFAHDPAYNVVPFRIETNVVNGVSPTLENATIQIVAVKQGEDDFILEEKLFNTSLIRKLNNKQTINIEDSRNFILQEGSAWNRANLIRYSDVDSGTKIGYAIQYGFVLRYESWIDAIQSSQGASVDIFKDIDNVTQDWVNYSGVSGWSLKFRVNFQVKGYNGFITNFTTQTDITVLDSTAIPTDGPQFKSIIKYFSESGDEVDGIIQGGVTRIVAGFKGEISSFPTGYDNYFGYLTADNNETGGESSRRIACSDVDSETDSPFSSVDLPSNNSISSYQSNNLRLSIFTNRVELDSWFTDNSESTAVLKNFIQSRFGFSKPSILLQENGYALLQENGDFILL